MSRSILVVGRGVPYPIEVGADAARFGLLSALTRAFRVTLVAAAEGKQAEQSAEALRAICEEVILVPPVPSISRGPVGFLVRNANLLLRGQPRELQAEGSARVGPVLERLTSGQRFGLAHFDYWTMAQYRRFAHCPAVLLNFDAWFETIVGYAQYSGSPLARLSWKLDGWATRRREMAAQRVFDWSLFFTEEDRLVMSQAWGDLPRSALLPLACPFDPVDEQVLAAPRDPLVLFTGAMGAPFNIDAVTYFVRQIWPLVRARLPETQFLITGREPDRRVIELGDTPGVTVAGWVPDLTDTLRRAAVFVAPMRIGTGIKVKVAHAMASGLPVVATSVALRGLPSAAGVFRADDPAESAARIVEILSNPALQQQLARSVVDTYRKELWVETVWPSIVLLYEQILDDVKAKPSGTG